MEKEVTGLYLSGHPMDAYRQRAARLGAVSIGSILSSFSDEPGEKRFADNQSVTVAGIVASVRTRATKTGTLMSYVVLEDDTASMELIAFQRTLDRYGAYLKENAPISCTGRISVRDEKEPQLMLNTVTPLDVDAPPEREQPPHTLWVRLPSRDDPAMQRIELVLTMFPGEQSLILYFADTKKRLGTQCIIHDALVQELRELLGDDNVVVK